MSAIADFARLLTLFFSRYLMQQRQVSPNTIASYRDTFRLLVNYANKVLGKPPQDLSFEDLDADLIGDFLNHLEHERGNDVRTRNARLAAIRSLFGYVALHEPQHAALAQRVLAIPISPGSELGRRAGGLRFAEGQTGHAPYPAPQRRHGTASQRR